MTIEIDSNLFQRIQDETDRWLQEQIPHWTLRDDAAQYLNYTLLNRTITLRYCTPPLLYST